MVSYITLSLSFKHAWMFRITAIEPKFSNKLVGTVRFAYIPVIRI